VTAGPIGFKHAQTASGYAGVWAKENTRESIFDAIERKEVYGTTGPCLQVIHLSFFTVSFSFTFNLETAVGSQKSMQALDAPRKIKKCFITHKMTTNFLISPYTPIPYASFLRPTAVSRLKYRMENVRSFQ